MEPTPLASGAPVARSDDAIPLMRRVAVVMLLVGGAVCLSGVWITQTERSGQIAQGLIAAGFLACGVLLLVARSRHRAVYEAAVIVSVALISSIIAFGRPFGMAPFFYLWPVVYAAYFSSRRVLTLTYGLMVLTLGPALLVNPVADLKMDTFVGTASTVGLMAALVFTLTQRERHLRHELARAAETDPLTGLLNRRSFDPRFAATIDESLRWRRPLSVVMLDIDHFKRLNDELGHHIGDLALQHLSAVLRAESREGDLVSRYGGEEFAVVLPGADLGAARAYTERVASTLRGTVVEGTTMTVSAGIAGTSTGLTRADEMMKLADEALYAAKAAGRCRHAVWNGEIVVGPRFGEPAPAAC